MPTVGLVMIVKNEAHVIERCLASVGPLVDFVLVCDTGSTDSTRAVIEAFLARENLPGTVIERAWRNFAHNRSEALAALREIPGIEYGFTIDADETLSFDSDLDIAEFKASLTADLYTVEVRNAGTIYGRPALFSNLKPFLYKAVLHEYLEAPPGSTRADATGLHVVVSHDGARSQNPNKFADDARLLEEALETETDPFLISRYTFYLAQSYRDSGQLNKAHAAYLKRAEQGYWVEEVYVSLVRAGHLADKIGRAVDEQIATFLRAYELIPARAEALHGAAMACRKAGRHHLGYVLARHGLTLPLPASGLFLDQGIYDYSMLDEFQVNAYWAGYYRESMDAAATILHDKKFPEDQRDRLLANMDFALKKVTEGN